MFRDGCRKGGSSSDENVSREQCLALRVEVQCVEKPGDECFWHIFGPPRRPTGLEPNESAAQVVAQGRGGSMEPGRLRWVLVLL